MDKSIRITATEIERRCAEWYERHRTEIQDLYLMAAMYGSVGFKIEFDGRGESKVVFIAGDEPAPEEA